MKTLQRIICADDEPDMLMIIKLSLENIGGYQVLACASGLELLDSVDSWNPDLIILDAVMPGLTGLQTLARLREGRKALGVPVLFMTGSAGADQEDFMTAGAIGVLGKPFDPLRLAEDVANIWKASQNG